MPRLSDFDVLTFDCYGTLIDWETGLLQGLAPWLERHGAELEPREILETFARHESAQEEETPAMKYSELLARVHRRLAQEWQLPSSDEEAKAFGATVPSWPAFPDSTEALRTLQKYYRLVILSNVDRESFQASQKRLDVTFHRVFVAEDIGSYKPNPRNFEYMLRELGREGVTPDRILHTAQSLYHDHVPAARLGLATAWIDRRHAQQGWGATLPPPGVAPVDFHYNSLQDMAEARGSETRDV